MRSLWACSCCAVSLLAALLSARVDAAEFKRHDGVHRLAKAQITAAPELPRRDAACPASHSLCPNDKNGGCCPDGYGCATDSCFATTRGPQTCQGKVGYYACAADVGGGCCPEGHICQRGDVCAPASGQPYTQNCPANYFLCPQSVNFGCCPNGMGCAARQCYSTQPSTYVFTQTRVSTNANADVITTTVTTTTVATPSPPTGDPTIGPTDDPKQIVLKFYPSTVPKVTPSTTSSSNDPGLTTAQIAGIVAGVVGLLIIVVAAAYIIIRHLNKVVAVVESSKTTSTATRSKSRPPMHQFRPTASEVDDMSVDPLMMSPRPSHRRHDSDSDFNVTASPDLHTPYRDRSTPGSGGAYHAVPHGNGSSGERHESFDSVVNGGGYFDMLPGHGNNGPRYSQQSAFPLRPSVDSQTGSPYAPQHGRHWSNASEASSDVGSPGTRTPVLQELDATPVVPELPAFPPLEPSAGQRRRSSSGASTASNTVGRPPAAHPRRRSDAQTRNRSDSATAAGTPLGVVAEDTEVIGHYGPSDRMAGQTAAGLTRIDSAGTERGPQAS